MNGRAYPNGEPEGGAVFPPCPICPSDSPYAVVANTGRLGGLRCETCGFCFPGEPGEGQHPRNKRRRELWAEETRDRTEHKEAS